MFGGSEHEHPPENVFVDDVVLDVVGVMLHTESKQLQNEGQQLWRLKIIFRNKAHKEGQRLK